MLADGSVIEPKGDNLVLIPLPDDWAAVLSLWMLTCTHEEQHSVTPSTQRPVLGANLEKSPGPAPAPAAPQVASVTVTENIARRCDVLSTRSESPQFDFDESTLRPRGKDILSAVARCMKEGSLKNQDVIIVGHADPRGSEDYNLGLGMRRAMAVCDFLRDQGIALPVPRSGEWSQLDTAFVDRGPRAVTAHHSVLEG
jgi:peptidoglycan-associated lipoprotein